MTADANTPCEPVPGRLCVAVVTPEGSAYEGLAESVVIPAHDGEVAFLPGHAPFVGAIGVGELRVKPADDEALRYYLEGGVVQVLDGVITVLAESITPARDVDAAAAAAELAAARATTPTTDEMFAERDHQIDCARAKARVAGHDPVA